jgi:hypothetical protein
MIYKGYITKKLKSKTYIQILKLIFFNMELPFQKKTPLRREAKYALLSNK